MLDYPITASLGSLTGSDRHYTYLIGGHYRVLPETPKAIITKLDTSSPTDDDYPLICCAKQISKDVDILQLQISSQYSPLTAPVEIPEGKPNKEAAAMKKRAICKAIRVNRQATSVRQMSEWGMRQIQGGFPRLKDNMLLEETGDRRRIILKLLMLMYKNFHTARVGINTILNTYMSQTNGFFSYNFVPTETANDVL
eukprot:jgi/Psemu1/28463/gm1.28463_g